MCPRGRVRTRERAHPRVPCVGAWNATRCGGGSGKCWSGPAFCPPHATTCPNICHHGVVIRERCANPEADCTETCGAHADFHATNVFENATCKEIKDYYQDTIGCCEDSPPVELLAIPILNSFDDVEHRDGEFYPDSSDLELGNDGSKPNDVGLRYVNINIPRHAKIVSARIHFTIEDDNSEPTSVTIRAQARRASHGNDEDDRLMDERG